MSTQDYATFRIEAIDDVSEPVESAAKALEGLQGQIAKDTRALSELQKALKNLRGAANPNIAEITKLESILGKTKQRLAENQQQALNLGQRFGAAKKSSGSFKDKLRELADAVKKPKTEEAGAGATSFKDKLAELSKVASGVPGPMGSVLSTALRWVSVAGSARLVTLALGGAVIALGVAALKAASHLTEFAIAAANARRNELLQLEAVTKLRTVYATTFRLGQDKAEDLQATIDKVSASVSISREEVAGYTMQLEKAGVRGKNMAPALQAVAMAASGFGKEQADRTLAWSASLALTGGNVQRLADRVKSQIGGVVSKQMLSLEVQQRKLAESQQALFSGIDIKPYLLAKKGLADLVSQSTNSGAVMKRVLSGIAGPFIGITTAVLRGAKIMFQELIIFALKFENKWLDFRLAIKGGGRDLGKIFANIGKLVASAWLDAAVGLAKFAFNFAVWAVKTMFRVSLVVQKAFWEFGPQLIKIVPGLIYGVFEALYQAWATTEWKALGVSLVDGLIDGVKSMGDALWQALKELAASAVTGFKTTLFIQSPSKVFADLGAQIPAGVTVGVKAGTPAAQSSVEDMITPPATAPGGAARALGGGGPTVNITTLQVTVGKGASADDARPVAMAIKRELETILQGLAVQMGAPVT